MLDDYPDILTVREVMEILGLGKNKVYELLGQKVIKGMQLGKVWRIPKESIKSLFVFK